MKHHPPLYRTASLLTLSLVLFGPEPVFAGSFWAGFKQYWGGFFGRQNGIVMAALLVGAISVFIVTRGKWRK